ncbi:MAG: serine/threonine-protein kinase [Planctomycetota bacterium]
MSSSRQPAPDRELLADLVASCILAFERDGERAVDRLLDDHPALAHAAREQLGALRAAGLLVAPVPDPEMVGPYRILRRLGSGGVGTVFLAEQRSPVRREVAIKVIRPGMDSREVLARFALERQALALLDHPNVARILDAGTTDDGRPYLCMEYVRGVPITKYCDERGLGICDRVQLMTVVCDAVHAAHQKGILHRDLKPGNILVGDREGRPWPTVIDFGVAKSLGRRILDVTLHTGLGHLVGTPEYMSPEQAANEIDVDTRTDVHALGVVLFELLTGQIPFASERLRRADPGELVRILQHEDPPRPSVAAGAAPLEIAARRGESVGSLARALRGELDWIVERATEKDRNRRYGMAAEMAQDLRNHLSGHPIAAGPRSVLYRWRKFARRHRLEVGSAMLVGASVLAGLITSVSFYTHAVARAAESERSLDVALEAVERMVAAGEDQLEVVPRMEEVRLELLREAQDLHRKLATVAADERLRERMARALFGLARVEGQLGDQAAALRSAAQARELLSHSRSGNGATVASLELRTEIELHTATWRQSLGAERDDLAAILVTARESAEALLELGEPSARHRVLLARVLAFDASIGRFERTTVETSLSRAREVLAPVLGAPSENAPVAVDAVTALASMATILIELGAVEEMTALAKSLRSIAEQLFAAEPDSVRRARILPAFVSIAEVTYRLEEFGTTVAVLEPVIEARRQLVRDFPAMPSHRVELADALVMSAVARKWLAKFDLAMAELEEALALHEELARQQPHVPDHSRRVLHTMGALASLPNTRAQLRAEVDWSVAESWLARCAQMLAEPKFRDPGNEAEFELLAEIARTEGTMYALRGQFDRAVGPQRRAWELHVRALSSRPDSPRFAIGVVDAGENLCRSLLALERYTEAAPVLAEVKHILARFDSVLAGRRRAVLRHRELTDLSVRVAIGAGNFDEIESGIDAYLATTPQPQNDWVGHENAANLALLAVRRCPPDSPWRARFASRCRTEVAAAIATKDEMANTPPLMIAIMTSNTTRTLVQLEREIGDLAAAAAAQRLVADGYLEGQRSRPSDRSRTRACDALTELAELQRAIDDREGLAATERSLSALTPR